MPAKKPKYAEDYTKLRLQGEDVTVTPFVKSLADEYGDKGELALYAYLLRRYPEPLHQVIHWPDGDTGADFVVTGGSGAPGTNIIFWGDSEVRTDWKTGLFFFDTIHVPYRKKAMIQTRVPFFYFGIRSDHKLMYVIPGPAILSSPVVLVKNRVHPSGDDMFDIPRDFVRNYYDLETGEHIYDDR